MRVQKGLKILVVLSFAVLFIGCDNTIRAVPKDSTESSSSSYSASTSSNYTQDFSCPSSEPNVFPAFMTQERHSTDRYIACQNPSMSRQVKVIAYSAYSPKKILIYPVKFTSAGKPQFLTDTNSAVIFKRFDLSQSNFETVYDPNLSAYDGVLVVEDSVAQGNQGQTYTAEQMIAIYSYFGVQHESLRIYKIKF